MRTLGITTPAELRQADHKLAQRRAYVVAEALERLGVSRTDLMVSARGQDDPRIPSPAGAGEAQNRRVEIVFPEE
jgi:outer membrane protein OmpA-like peptidoglycan-associated protein